MHKIFKYSVSFLLIFILSIIVLDFLILPTLTKRGNELYLPDVRSMHISEAEKKLEKFNLKVHYMKYNPSYKKDEVIATSPRPFTKVKIGRDIKISIASAKQDFIMDDFINKSYRSTKLLLDRNNILIDTTIYEYNENIIKDNIIYHYPKSGKKITDSTPITLVVSSGNPPDYYRVPDLINKTLNNAIEEIAKAGLLLGKVRYEYDSRLLNNTVLEQDPPKNKKLSIPLEINLIISKDTTENE
tara:strand:+ start:28883 stop:29611 length:729 start_codon:yes stop_codon:yes gene_type:complete